MVDESTSESDRTHSTRRALLALGVALGLVALLALPDGQLPEATIPIATGVGVAVYAGSDSGRCSRA